MKTLFLDTRVLDRAARERYGLTEEIMMENAACALERAVMRKLFPRGTDGANGTECVAESAAGAGCGTDCAAGAAKSAVAAGTKPACAKNVLILCGSGNNGADGYALARRLAGCAGAGAVPIVPVVVSAREPKSELCLVQAARAKKCGVRCVEVEKVLSARGADEDAQAVVSAPDANVGAQAVVFDRAAVIVDCIFGSGFHGDLDEHTVRLCRRANAAGAVRIACDVPTGVREDGTVAEDAFCADCTVTMGALKLSLYSDAAIDVVGEVFCENLGVSRALFEHACGCADEAAAGDADGAADVAEAAAMLLEADDLVLPHRPRQLVNKGSFGHAAVASGEKIGASCIAGAAALRFGAGLVSLVRLGHAFEKSELPQVTPELMTAQDFPANTTAVALGMGLGRADEIVQPYFDWLCARKEIPCVVDADACFCGGLKVFLEARAKGTVLTPHPKEFQTVLKNCGLGDHSVADCVNNRPALMQKFCRAFPHAVLLVKGANPMIGMFDGKDFRLFVNPWGTNALAKAGSGDVLAGLICALLAQGRDSLDAAVNGSLAHALASRKFKNEYSLTPLALVDAVARL